MGHKTKIEILLEVLTDLSLIFAYVCAGLFFLKYLPAIIEQILQ